MKIKWLLGGNIIYAITQWLLLVIFTRFYSSESVGEYFFSLSLIAPIALLLSLKMPNLVVTLDESLTFNKNIYFTRHLISLILIVVTYIVYFIFFRENTNILILTSVLIYKILEQNDEVKISYLQKAVNFKGIFLIKSVRSLVYLSLIIIFCALFSKMKLVLISSTVTYTIFWIYRNRDFLVLSTWKEEKSYIQSYVKNGIFLSLSSSLSSFNVSGVRLYIGYVLGSSSLAIFGVISYSLVVFSIIVAALGQYFLPYFVKYQTNPKVFNGLVFKSQVLVISIGLFCIIVSIIFGDFLLKSFYGKEYGEYGIYLVFVFIANIFKSSSALIGTAMTSMRIYNFQLKFTFIMSLATIVVIPLFIKYFGMFGAFYGLILVSLVEWFLYILFAKKTLWSKFHEST